MIEEGLADFARVETARLGEAASRTGAREASAVENNSQKLNLDLDWGSSLVILAFVSLVALYFVRVRVRVRAPVRGRLPPHLGIAGKKKS